jgi:ABC-type polysaccharide/polyol phosphate export permease
MSANVGTVDRILRIVVGIILIALVFVGPHTPWGWIGVIPLVTGIVGFCPAYSAFGLNTCAKK